jgi:hypothetical protein
MSSGRNPASSDRSATRAARFADLTEAKVAPASTSVPPAVASEEIVTQSAMPSAILRRDGTVRAWMATCSWRTSSASRSPL